MTVLRDHSRYSLGKLYMVPGIEPRSAASKESALPAGLATWPLKGMLLKGICSPKRGDIGPLILSQRQRDTGLQAELVGGGPRWLWDPESALTSPDRSKHPWLARCTCGMFAARFSRENGNCEVVHGSGGHQTNWGFPRAFWPWKSGGFQDSGGIAPLFRPPYL